MILLKINQPIVYPKNGEIKKAMDSSKAWR